MKYLTIGLIVLLMINCGTENKKTYTVEKTPEEIEEDEQLRLNKEANMRLQLEEHDKFMRELQEKTRLQATSNLNIQKHYLIDKPNPYNHTHCHNLTNIDTDNNTTNEVIGFNGFKRYF